MAMLFYERINGRVQMRETKCVTFSENYDLVVAGVGSAGTFCALSAAQEGLRVCGLERGACCGGMSVQGAVNGYYNGYPGGMYEKMDDEANASLSKVWREFFNHPDAKKRVLEKSLLNAGVNLRYHAVIVGIYAEKKRVVGIRALCEGELRDIGCTFLSDSTSDAYVLRILGLPGSIGRPTDGTMQPFSSVRLFRLPDGRLGRTNHDSGYIDQYDPSTFSQAVVKANASHTDDRLNDKKAGRFLFVAPQAGIREGMRIEGEETLSLRDILNEKDGGNTLVCAFSDIDRHGQDWAFDDSLYQDWYVLSNLSTVTFKIRVPLGSIVPKGWEGLAAVSRCLSVDNYASSAVRMNRDMYRLGEAAGVALAMAVKGSCGLMCIDIDALQKKLRARSCFDPHPDEKRGFMEKNSAGFVPIKWITDPDEIRRQLATDCPGTAFWSCRRMGLPVMKDALLEMMGQHENETLRLNAAVALGNMGDSTSLPVLREIVRNRCEYHYLDCRRTNQMRSVIAICLCGRLGDTEIVPELLEILKPDEFDRPMYHAYTEPSYKLSIMKEYNSVYYQHLSFAAAALAAIAEKHPERKHEIIPAIKRAFADGSYMKRVTSDRENGPYDLITRELRIFAEKLPQA